MNVEARLRALESKVDRLEQMLGDGPGSDVAEVLEHPRRRKALLRRLAARARAAKPIGKGRGAVSAEAAARMRKQNDE